MKKKLIKVVFFSLLVIGLIPSYVRIFIINGPSMLPTIFLGDRVVANMANYDIRLPYSNYSMVRVSDPQRGDLVFYDDPRGFYGLKELLDYQVMKLDFMIIRSTSMDSELNRRPHHPDCLKVNLKISI